MLLGRNWVVWQRRGKISSTNSKSTKACAAASYTFQSNSLAFQQSEYLFSLVCLSFFYPLWVSILIHFLILSFILFFFSFHSHRKCMCSLLVLFFLHSSSTWIGCFVSNTCLFKQFSYFGLPSKPVCDCVDFSLYRQKHSQRCMLMMMTVLLLLLFLKRFSQCRWCWCWSWCCFCFSPRQSSDCDKIFDIAPTCDVQD